VIQAWDVDPSDVAGWPNLRRRTSASADDAYKFTAQAKQNLRNYIEPNFLTAQKAYRAGARMVVAEV
jgi:hypothetical protein